MIDAQDWHAFAACRGVDPDLFFPERGESVDEARAVCLTCRVTAPCLEGALLRNERWGIWAGTSDRERRRIRKEISAGRLTLAEAAQLGRAAAPSGGGPTHLALLWVATVLDDDRADLGWRLLTAAVRRQLVAAWAPDHPELIGPLSLPAPVHPVWPRFVAHQRDRWHDAAPAALRARGGPWRLLERPRQTGQGRSVVALFVQPDDPEAPIVPAGAVVPAWPVGVTSGSRGWRIDGVGSYSPPSGVPNARSDSQRASTGAVEMLKAS